MRFSKQWSELYGFELWRMIRNMKHGGMSIRSIAREMGISRNSDKKHLKGEPVKKNKKKRSSKLDPYRDTVKELIERDNLSAVRILEEIRKDTMVDTQY